MRKMKTLLALSAMVVFAAGVMSCGEPAETGPQNVSLTVWGGEEDQVYLKQVTDAFVAANETEDLKINITLGVVSESTAKDTILEDPQAAADVFAFADDQLDDLVKAGCLQNVGAVSESIAESVKTRNNAGSVTAATSDGNLYAMPITADNGFFLYYDNSVVSADDVKSYESLLEACKAKSTADMRYVVSDQFRSGWYLDGWFRAAGLVADKNEAGDVTTCDWNSAKGIEVVKSIMTLTCGEYSDYFMNLKDEEFASDVSRSTGYRVVAGANGAWNAGTVEAAYGDGYAATKLPTFKCGGEDLQRMSVAGFKLLGVSRFSENTGLAVRLADWISNEENQALRYEMRQQGPSNINAAADPDVQENIALSGLIAQSAYGITQKVTSNFWTPTESLSAAIYSGYNGETSLITSGRGTANLVFDDAAIKSLLDTAVTAITTPVE